jgi:hypothetical protein
MNLTRAALAFIAALAIATQSLAAPLGFTYQGELKVEGDTYTGSADIIVSLFDGSTLLDTETFNNVQVDTGVFELVLGFDSALFNRNPRQLRFSVRAPSGTGSYTPLNPPHDITAAPYAYHATTADTLRTPASLSSTANAPTLSLGHTIADNQPALRVTKGATDNALASFIQRTIETESTLTPIGLLATADLFPIVGVVDSFTADTPGGIALFGQVSNDAGANHSALFAQNLFSGTSALLGTNDFAGRFIGDLRVDGSITTDYASGSFDLATPIAYGFVQSNGTISAGTPNLSCTWNPGLARYEIEIDNENYFFSNYVTIATMSSEIYTISTTSASGRLIIKIRNGSTGALDQAAFQFAVFKPSGSPLLRGQQPRTLTPLTTPLTDDQLQRQAPLPPRDPIPTPDTHTNPLKQD